MTQLRARCRYHSLHSSHAGKKHSFFFCCFKLRLESEDRVCWSSCVSRLFLTSAEPCTLRPAEQQVCSQCEPVAVFKGLLRSGDAELRVSRNGLWNSYQVWLLKGTQTHHFRENRYSQRNGKKNECLALFKSVSLCSCCAESFCEKWIL